jgi:hypothetical protein
MASLVEDTCGSALRVHEGRVMTSFLEQRVDKGRDSGTLHEDDQRA